MARSHKELFAWQRAADLRRLVLKYTREGPGRQDFDFCRQIRSAARSACYTTSEGYYRKRDGDFLNFLVWARGSLGEAGDQIDEGLENKYFTPAQHAEMITILRRACKANTGLRRYLEAARERTGKPDERTAPRTRGPKDPRTRGPKDPRTPGPPDPRT